MLYVNYVLEKVLDVIAIIDIVLTPDRCTHVRTRDCDILVSSFEETICVTLHRMQWPCTQPTCAICSVHTIDGMLSTYCGR